MSSTQYFKTVVNGYGTRKYKPATTVVVQQVVHSKLGYTHGMKVNGVPALITKILKTGVLGTPRSDAIYALLTSGDISVTDGQGNDFCVGGGTYCGIHDTFK